MKMIYLLSLSLLFFSFTDNNSLKKEFTEIEINNKTLYIGKYEVSNGNYYQFLNDIKYDGKLLTKARVFSQEWNKFIEFSKAFEDYYFGNEAYSNYPVVNITHEGAELYCAWFSEKMSKELGQKVIARLPTKEEWMHAAKGGNENAIYGWNSNNTVDKLGNLLGNFKIDDAENKTITAPVDAYKPNKIGLYNCSGNVAEMIQTNNISMGGSWRTSIEDIALNKSAQDYSSANPYTGFRIVLELE